MYTLIKLFDKTVLVSGETIERFHFKPDGTIFAIETDKSVYELKKV